MLQTSARNIAKVFLDAKLECDEEEYVKGFNSGGRSGNEILEVWNPKVF